MTSEPVETRLEEDPLKGRVSSKSGFAGYVARGFRRWRIPLLLVFLVLICYEVAWLTFLTPGEADVVHYECYGLTFWLGSHGTSLLPPASCRFLSVASPQPVWHMLPQEYPPLTILLFSLPLLAPLPYYAFIFALLMTLSAGLIYWLLARSKARGAAPIFLLYLLLGAAGVFQERFDLLPAAYVLISLLTAERGHWRTAYLALALAVLLKIYPLVMLPALFLAEQRVLSVQRALAERPENLIKSSARDEQSAQRTQGIKRAERGSRFWLIWEKFARLNWRNLLLCVGLLLLVMGAFALLNFDDAILSPLHYFLQRPPQIESLVASFIWLGGHVGVPYTINFTFGSLNMNSGLVRLLSPVDTLCTVAGLLGVYWLQWRRRIDLAQSLTGLVCVLIATGKVFSPQYLIWLVPLLAYICARGQTNRLWMLAWAAISLLTTFIYIFYYSRMPDPQTAPQMVLTLPGFFVLVALRNLLLAFTTLAFLCGWWGVRADASRYEHARDLPSSI